ncbi:aminoglycoside phosphotransferase family protein [Actinokineospora sp. UTMC 2448]|uniref:aminoglycoside phosphotransferase family protein n=1 Tax=Actinokineospora sp. UTMC 2448 TaxID=2268449 RepID=UPI0021648C1E|nr:aminoglycoside phosphotransferase family protein [Actinokineospora sp. UTMC 2448]
MRDTGWTSAGWRAEAVAWLDDALARRGVVRCGEVEQPRVRPWATVLCAETSAGRVWLKASGAETAFEAGLYLVLHEVVPESVLEPLAVDAERGWVVLPDGGASLGGVSGLGDALVAYARMQRRLMPHVDRLLAAGVADMRPEVLPRRLSEAVAVVGGGLPAEFADGIAARWVAEWAAELAASALPASLDHNDLHPDNVLTGPRFYDWGDSVVAHPFAAAMLPLSVIGDGLGEAAAVEAGERYLAEFTDFAPIGRLRRELALARRLGIVARTLTWARAAGAAPEFADAPRLTLLSLLDEPRP